MNKQDFSFLKELVETPSPSGYEQPAQRVIRRQLENAADSIDSDVDNVATLLRLSPPLFPLACAGARFAPVYVGDVVEAMVRALADDKLAGQRLELCGPEVYTLQKLVQYTAGQIGKNTLVIGLPDFAARLQGHLLGLVPGKPFTIDNYYSLQKDSVCTTPALIGLGIKPRSVEAIVPTYLGDKRSRAQFTRYRASSRR